MGQVQLPLKTVQPEVHLSIICLQMRITYCWVGGYINNGVVEHGTVQETCVDARTGGAQSADFCLTEVILSREFHLPLLSISDTFCLSLVYIHDECGSTAKALSRLRYTFLNDSTQSEHKNTTGTPNCLTCRSLHICSWSSTPLPCCYQAVMIQN